MKKRRKKVVAINRIKDCGNGTVYWPRIKVSSACIGKIPINIPEVSIIPTVKRYFYYTNSNIDLTGGATIPSNLFLNDDGDQATEFTMSSSNGYANLYINGVIQMGGLYKLNTNYLTIIPVNSRILAGTTIIVESLGYSTKGIY